MKKRSTLYIRNMVCHRCVLAVETILKNQHVSFKQISLGEVVIDKSLTDEEYTRLNESLIQLGFELIGKRVNQIIEKIKKLVLQYIALGDDKKLKLSAFITSELHYDYSYLSDLFSSVEGITIEQYLIVQRIEKVKELVVYEELSLTEIAFKTGFSSVHHLSAQFKKVTGLTPSHFKALGSNRRRSIDSI